jgi:hypothetical protein
MLPKDDLRSDILNALEGAGWAHRNALRAVEAIERDAVDRRVTADREEIGDIEMVAMKKAIADHGNNRDDGWVDGMALYGSHFVREWDRRQALAKAGRG